VDVTLVDRRNFHLFQPLLYQVATGGLSPANISAPLRAILARQKNTEVLLDEATGLDPARHCVLLAAAGELEYDYLIVATGARHDYFGHDDWAELAPGLKTVEDALEIRGRLLLAFETAERERLKGSEAVPGWLTFVVVGGGPTGVELAGAVAEIARHTLREEYRLISPEAAQVMLVEGLDRVLPTYPPSLSGRARDSLEGLGVNVRTSTFVREVGEGYVMVESGGQQQRIDAQTVLWAAGVRASRLGRALADSTGAEVDRAGRVKVLPDLTLPGCPEIYVIGDLATLTEGGKPIPAVAPTAMQQGRYAAESILARLEGKTPPPFHYRDLGSLATIGRSAAVADLGHIKLWGHPAWLAWLFIHLMNLARFENRLLVLVQWAWNYITRNRSARLITGRPAERAIKRRP
jgi:NADH dehydrogenase